MKFADFEFDSNPSVIKATLASKVKSDLIFGGSSVTQKIAYAPAEVSGTGVFYDKNAETNCQLLSRMMKRKKSDWLYCPGIYPIKAFLSEFSYELSSKSSAVKYSFVFVQDCSNEESERAFEFTAAADGENAFDIANRCSVSVDDIMRYNNLKSPFDIDGKRRIYLYENSNEQY